MPQEKINAIQSLGVGVVNIINIEFQASVMKEGWTGVNFLWTEQDLEKVNNSTFSWILGIIGFYPFGNQTEKIWAINQGKAAIEMESASKSDLQEGFTFLVNQFLNQQESAVKIMKITLSKPYAKHRGSFAYESVTSELFQSSRDDFKEPVLNAQR